MLGGALGTSLVAEAHRIWGTGLYPPKGNAHEWCKFRRKHRRRTPGGVAGASLLPRATAYSITWGSGVVALTPLDRPCKRQPRRGAGTDARLGRRPDPQGAKNSMSPFSKFGRNRTSSAARERGDSGDAAGKK